MVVLLALLAAAGYATSSVLQQRAVAAEPQGSSHRITLLLRLARRPWWLAGKAVDVVATILQAVAIHLGSVVQVEPLLASGLLFALPLGRGGRPGAATPDPKDWLGAVALTGGLALFMAMSRSSGGRSDATATVWLTAGAVVAGVVVVMLAMAQDDARPHRPALLAAAGGVLYACTAVLTKPATQAFTAGPARLAQTWQLYALLTLSLVAATAIQTAFQVGTIAASLPTLTAIEPVAGVALGIGVLGEHLTTGLGSVPPLGLAIFGMLAGIVVLARSPLVAATFDEPVAAAEPADPQLRKA